MGGQGWKGHAGLAALLIAAYQVIPANPWWEAGWQVAVGCLAAAALLVGAARLPSVAERLPWWCFAFGVSANATGIAVDRYLVEGSGVDASPSWADPLWLLLYPGVAAGLALLIRRRERQRDWAALVDATIITTGLGLLGWVFVIQPLVAVEWLTTLGRTAAIAYPVGDILLIAMVVRLLRGSGARNSAYWWIIASLGSFLAGDIAWVVLGSVGVDVTGVNRLVEAVFLVAYSCLGLAALQPGAADVGRPAERGPRLSVVHLALLAGASMIAPAVLAGQVLAGDVTDGAAIVVGSAALFLLVVTRMAQLLRQVERQSHRLRELSRTDELTGLPNRRAWNDEVPRALERARRERGGLAVAILDLDHFKIFNDCYGHPAGDRLLKSAAAAWQEELRGVDLLARYGGEEFVVLLPGADGVAAAAVLERLQETTPLGQSFSAGVATWDGTETSDVLVQRADDALYAAKAAGRNRITPAPAGALA